MHVDCTGPNRDGCGASDITLARSCPDSWWTAWRIALIGSAVIVALILAAVAFYIRDRNNRTAAQAVIDDERRQSATNLDSAFEVGDDDSVMNSFDVAPSAVPTMGPTTKMSSDDAVTI